jgi:hypothetical protein
MGIMAQPAPCAKNTFLIEWCCHEDSELMNQWVGQGGKGLRVALPRFDARRRQVVDDIRHRIRRKLDAAQHVRMHISLPCTCWSQWGRLNAARSDDYRARREQQRKESRSMLRHVLTILEEFKGQHFGASFEWPAGCDGFNEALCPEMKQLRRQLPFSTLVHGCAYGSEGHTDA